MNSNTKTVNACGESSYPAVILDYTVYVRMMSEWHNMMYHE